MLQRTALTIAALLALPAGGCATSPRTTVASALPAIAMETFSWGVPVSDWRVEADGDGTYSYARPVPGGAFRDYDLVTHRFSAGRAGFARVARLLAGPARGYQCEIEVTDMPYGRVVFTGAEPAPPPFAFNFGCLSTEARAAYSQMAQAEALVRGWAVASPASDVVEVRQPRP